MKKSEAKFRIDELQKLCKGKSVLHLGYVQHDHLFQQLEKSDLWVHKRLSNVAARIVGIDYLEDAVQLVYEKWGFEGYCGNAEELEKVDLQEKFDVIVCGELIEHVFNQGKMLEGIKRFMHLDSTLIVTTPNAWGMEYHSLVLQNTSEDKWINAEHICWHSHFTLATLLTRNGFKEVDYGYYFGFNNREDYFEQGSGALSQIKNLMRRREIAKTNLNRCKGLFFVAKQ